MVLGYMLYFWALSLLEFEFSSELIQSMRPKVRGHEAAMKDSQQSRRQRDFCRAPCGRNHQAIPILHVGTWLVNPGVAIGTSGLEELPKLSRLRIVGPCYSRCT